MGIDIVYDPDPTYELTADNVKKMLAIYMRFRFDLSIHKSLYISKFCSVLWDYVHNISSWCLKCFKMYASGSLNADLLMPPHVCLVLVSLIMVYDVCA